MKDGVFRNIDCQGIVIKDENGGQRGYFGVGTTNCNFDNIR